MEGSRRKGRREGMRMEEERGEKMEEKGGRRWREGVRKGRWRRQ